MRQTNQAATSCGRVFLSLAVGLAAVAQAAAVQSNEPDVVAEAKVKSSVDAALKWLAQHQQPDGSWNFDHRGGKCADRCPNHGSLTEGQNAATAMALLPFLGAGETHKKGKHKKVIRRGLRFLTENADQKEETASFNESGGRMYSHGLCTIVLCEAYGRSRDKKLRGITQSALNFIVDAQDPVGGGWRYNPRQAGDTSVGGWQMSAIHSGQMAGLELPNKAVKGAIRFLDGVQSDGGAKYGYTIPGAGKATTSIGLLSRLRLGWGRDHEAIRRGVQFLQDQGLSERNMYYNYYATQVMCQYGGEPWHQWHEQLRALLTAEQDREGHSAGSWHIAGDHGADRGGRLYCTSLATLMLEVHDRHLAIFQPSKKMRKKDKQ